MFRLIIGTVLLTNIPICAPITVPANKKYSSGTVPANKKYAAGIVPANKKYAAGTVPANKK